MSLNKAIAFGKEHRRSYRRAARFVASCRNGGSCPYCTGNRTHAGCAREAAARQDLVADLSEDYSTVRTNSPIEDD